MSSPSVVSFTLATILLLLLGPLAGPAASAKGDAVWPLLPRPEVVAGFDPPEQDWEAGHRGVDLLGTAGQPVRAARAGRVTYAGRLAGRGIVVISHGDTRTTYQPVKASVRVGAVVLTGQKVGVLESMGSHCWPRTCLHWGLLRGETYLDPLTLVGAGPVRLLPFYGVLAAFGFGPPADLITPSGVPAGRPAAVGPW